MRIGRTLTREWCSATQASNVLQQKKSQVWSNALEKSIKTREELQNASLARLAIIVISQKLKDVNLRITELLSIVQQINEATYYVLPVHIHLMTTL